MARKKGPKKPKLPKYVLVDQATQEGKGVYAVLADALKQWHSHLREAKIVAAWMVGNKADKDGRLILGRMKKTSELDRELAPYDFVLLLNREHWRSLDEAFRLGLVDHELCHADQKNDPTTGDQVEDAHGRKLWRIRKHDIEEFAAVVRRHGFYKSDIESFAEALEQGKQAKLFADKSKGAKAAKPGQRGKTAGAEAVAP